MPVRKVLELFGLNKFDVAMLLAIMIKKKRKARYEPSPFGLLLDLLNYFVTAFSYAPRKVTVIHPQKRPITQ